MRKEPPSSSYGAVAYRKARDMFFDALMAHEVTDLLSARTLERAYLWTLLARSAYMGGIRLASYPRVISVEFKCRSIGTGPIFRGDNILQYDGSTLDMDIGWMEPETIY